jgi:cell division protein FtsZ
LLAAVCEKTRFDNYDPLGEVIPKENILDWDEMDSSPDIQITIPNNLE